MQSKIDRYWKQFQRSLTPAAERPQKYDSVFYFGSKQAAQKLATLVIEGTKTASGRVHDDEPLWKPGDLSVVTDGRDHPVCITEDTEVKVIPFDEVDERYAYDYGEGDRTLDDWRKGYWDEIVAECARTGWKPTRQRPLFVGGFGWCTKNLSSDLTRALIGPGE